MKKAFVQPFAIFWLVAATFMACSSKYPGYDKTESGLYYKIFKVATDTVKPRTGDWISLDYRMNGISKGKDTLLFNSKSQNQGPIRMQLPPSDYKGDIYEGLRMLSPGDSASFILNADSLFRKTFRQPVRPAFIDTNSMVTFTVHLLTVENAEGMMKKEQESLREYISKNNISVQPTATGIYFIEKAAGTGMKIDSGCQVKLHFRVSLIDGKEIFSSFNRPDPLQFVYGRRFDTPGLDEGVGMMKKGGKATIVVPSSMAFGEMGRGNFVPPFSTVVYDVEIVDVLSKAQYEKEQADQKKKEEEEKEKAKQGESVLLQKYLKDNNITVKPTATGLYYIEKAKGTGPKPVPGKKVKVHYTGTLLNGKKFDYSRDRNEPFEFTLGKGEVIKGWDEGIALMNQGGKAILIVPSTIAYGDRSMGDITPYSTLVFDVELIEVK